MNRIYLVVAFLLLSVVSMQAQITKVWMLTKAPALYEKTDWSIELIQTWENPYLQEDIALDMILTAPSGKKLSLPCYYESGASGTSSKWKARFLPQEQGRYRYLFRLSKGGQPENTSKGGSFKVKSSTGSGMLHAKNNWTFAFDNGQPFRGIGENIGWESRANDDSKFFKALHEKPKYNYEYMLRSLAQHGGNYFRTWVSSFNLPVDWKRGFNSNRYSETTEYFNPGAIAKMDRLVYLCDSLHLYMMLTLGQGAYHTRDGGFAASAADFFVNPKAKAQYKNRLRYFVARWGYSPSIGAWEFFNEVDNVQFSNRSNPVSADSIVQWHDEMSTYLKGLDPYHHLVTTSISHRDLKGLNALANLDFNQKHIYRNTKGIPAAITEYEKTFGKPYVIGEFSYEWDWSKDFNLFGADMDSDFKRGLWYGLFSPTPILPLSWWWEYFDDRGTDAYLSRVRAISDRMLTAGNGSFEEANLSASATGLELHSVRCGKQTFAYLFNPSDSVKVTVVDIGNIPASAVQAYNCESGKYSDVNLSGKDGKVLLSELELPAKSDLVLIITTK